MLKAKNQKLPWRHMIEQRDVEFDPELEPELNRMRVEHFYGAPPEPRPPRSRGWDRWLAPLLTRR
jgi:hypothetical protein